MMRFAILADIHGNLPALEAVLDDVRHDHVDGIWTLGDYLIGGPGQNEVMRRLYELGSVFILGNNEEYLLDYSVGRTPERRTAKQWAPMRWACQHLDPQWLDLIRILPEQRVIAVDGAVSVRAHSVRLVHGSHRRIREPLLPDRDPERVQRFREAGFWANGDLPTCLRDALDGLQEPVLVCGHTHIPWVQREVDILAFNPGSVGGPIDGDKRAQYAILTWTGDEWQVELKGAAYDSARIYDDFVRSGYWDEVGAMARALWLGMRSGQNVVYGLLLHARQLMAQAGIDHLPVVPDDIWDRAVDTFDWRRAEDGLPMFD
ncbi:MAG: metallophosphoesterase family protein [Anaerolineae bacterium]|nr:metallophosphoesterase family protein [Anaerolineae bacterium]